MFIGRKEELKELHECLNSSKFESVILYGRRRVGKSEIIKEAMKNAQIPVVNFECKKTSSYNNLSMLIKAFTGILKLPEMKFESFDDFITYAFEYSKENDFVLVIDEFSFLLDDDFTIESTIAVAIDKYKNESRMKLIISGSYITLMTKMIEYGSHSYGRFNHILLIRPFDYYTVSGFYPNYSAADKIKMYSVFGGIPYFNSLIDNTKSADENIINLLVKKDSILEHEITEMILMETNKVTLLNDLISIIGEGINKYKDIVCKMNQHNGARPEYLLNKLLELNIIRKVTPINDKSNSKRMFYQFEDNLIHFYYRYLFNSPYSINRENPSFFYEHFIKDDFERQYVPKKFERISMEFLMRCNFKGKLDNIIMDIGTYFYDDAKNKINREFDVVTKDKCGYMAYECKYTDSLVSDKIISEELKQTEGIKDIEFYKLGFISKFGFDDAVDQKRYSCFSLNDFYADELA